MIVFFAFVWLSFSGLVAFVMIMLPVLHSHACNLLMPKILFDALSLFVFVCFGLVHDQ